MNPQQRMSIYIEHLQQISEFFGCRRKTLAQTYKALQDLPAERMPTEVANLYIALETVIGGYLMYKYQYRMPPFELEAHAFNRVMASVFFNLTTPIWPTSESLARMGI